MEVNLNIDSLNSLDIKQDVSELLKEHLPSETVVDNNNEEPTSRPRRSLRSTKRSNVESEVNHRTINKPKRLSNSSGPSEIKHYYLCKKVKRLPSTFETIFEEPKPTKAGYQYMSQKKFKRVLDFSTEERNNQHIKKRKRLLKAKKVTAQSKIDNKKKFTLEFVLKKLADLDDEGEKEI